MKCMIKIGSCKTRRPRNKGRWEYHIILRHAAHRPCFLTTSYVANVRATNGTMIYIAKRQFLSLGNVVTDSTSWPLDPTKLIGSSSTHTGMLKGTDQG